jgi:hypothetical protein
MATILGWLFLALATLQGGAARSDLLAIRVGRAETVSHGTIEHAVILVEKGKIVAVGQDLAIERGIPVLERPEWTVMPGLVNVYSRLGLSSRAGAEFTPQVVASVELDPADPLYEDLLDTGTTTLCIYPPGTGVAGMAVALRPEGDTREAMTVLSPAYLKIYFRSEARAKKMVRDAFAKVDEYIEKEKKAREKWEKDQEKAKKKPADDKKGEEKKGEEKKGEEKKGEEKPKEGAARYEAGAAQEPAVQDEKKPEKQEEAPTAYVPPEPDEKVKPFLDLRNKKLSALVSIGQAGDWLHWLDAIGKEDFRWDLRVPMTRELDIFEVAAKIGEKGCRIVSEPELTYHPGTLRLRNLPAELSRAGAKLVLIPRSDTLEGHERWLGHVGEIVAAGLPREVALKAVTLEAAGLLGLGERLGSLDKGKDANLLFLSGDPLEAGTQVKAVMLEGRFVFGEVQQ